MTATAGQDPDTPGLSQLSIQETLYPELTCFGCGQANLQGLRLRSFAVGDRVDASFRPRPEHENGAGYLNGGIAATLVDCHSGAAAHHHAQQQGWLSPAEPTPYVTAGLEVRYLRPTPLGDGVWLTASVAEAAYAQIIVDVELGCDGKVRVAGRGTWKRLRSR
jgi:acyl-coenzyme A thioesterase PaaI-like protein